MHCINSFSLNLPVSKSLLSSHVNTAFWQGLILNKITQYIYQLFGSKRKVTFSIVLDSINLAQMVHSEEESTGRSRNMEWLVSNQIKNIFQNYTVKGLMPYLHLGGTLGKEPLISELAVTVDKQSETNYQSNRN